MRHKWRDKKNDITDDGKHKMLTKMVRSLLLCSSSHFLCEVSLFHSADKIVRTNRRPHARAKKPKEVKGKCNQIFTELTGRAEAMG